MLGGDHGPGIQRAMDLLVRLGDSFDAEKLIPITYGHMSEDLCPGKFWDSIRQGDGFSEINKNKRYWEQI